MTTASRKRLPVDLPELCLALAADVEDVRWYLDLQTGDVVLVNREYEASEHAGLSADEIEQNAERFRRVPPVEAAVPLKDMDDYTAQVTDQRLRESLELALSAPRPERRFRAVLGWLPEEQDRWHAFRHERCRARAEAWLAAQGVEASARAETPSDD